MQLKLFNKFPLLINPLKSELRNPNKFVHVESSIFFGIVALFFVPYVEIKLTDKFSPCRLTLVDVGSMILDMIASYLPSVLAFFRNSCKSERILHLELKLNQAIRESVCLAPGLITLFSSLLFHL